MMLLTREQQAFLKNQRKNPQLVTTENEILDIIDRAIMSRSCCEWKGDEGFWETSCGSEFYLDGTPRGNKMNFCLFCGGRLIEKLTD